MTDKRKLILIKQLHARKLRDKLNIDCKKILADVDYKNIVRDATENIMTRLHEHEKLLSTLPSHLTTNYAINQNSNLQKNAYYKILNQKLTDWSPEAESLYDKQKRKEKYEKNEKQNKNDGNNPKTE